MKLFALTILTVVGCAMTIFAQTDETHIRVSAKVVSVPESSFDQEAEPPHDARLVVIYEVLKLLNGNLSSGRIKVAHGLNSFKKLRVGDKVTLEIKPTQDFREVAEILRETGTIRKEESIADFVFVQFETRCHCVHR